MRRLFAVLLSGTAVLAGGGSVSAMELEDLPEGPGREETFYTCSACHSFELVAQQGQTRQGWEDLLDWMIERQGMAPPEPAEREAIVAYLTEHFGVREELPLPEAPVRVAPVGLEDLPEGPGREEVFWTCSACHSFNLVVQQGQTRDGWAELLDWMIEEQGMDPPEDGERDVILDYLAAHFGPDRTFWKSRAQR